MPTASFTTRIDADLKAELEAMARFEDRSASWLANQAIRNFVEERVATRELLRAGLAAIAHGAAGIEPGAVHAWLSADDAAAFPRANGDAT
jgi:predicted transcriptional regulator